MRLDVFLYEKNKTVSRSRAKELIEKGAVLLNGKVILKPSYEISEDTSCESVEIAINTDKYVSRGGYKLEGAFLAFSLNVVDKIALDVGASTGGFTDCLLKNGAKKVYAVDSGKNQLVDSLRRDERVEVYENYNARYMKKADFDDDIQITVMDVSFISQTLILPQIADVLSDGGELVSLIKPQFEVGRANIGKNGIVKSEKARKAAIDNVCAVASEYGLRLRRLIESPIKGGDGNVEFLAYFKKELNDEKHTSDA